MAVQRASALDPIALAEFQRAARLLVGVGVVTRSFPEQGALTLVRRYEVALREEFSRLFAWSLRLDTRVARLVHTPLVPSEHRGLVVTRGERRRFTAADYAVLCLTIAALEGQRRQTTIRRLAEAIMTLRPVSGEVPVDFAEIAWRRSLVRVLTWLVLLGALEESADSDTASYIDNVEADALYTIDADVVRRLIPRLPDLSAEPDRDTLRDQLDGVLPTGSRGARQRLHRRIVEQTAVYYDELPADERQLLADRRSEISDAIARLFGVTIEARAEGIALIDVDSGSRLRSRDFPGTGNVGNVALAWVGRLRLADGTPSTRPAGRLVTTAAADDAWELVVASVADGLTDTYRDDRAALRRDVEGLLAAWDFARPHTEGIVVRPVAARFEPTYIGRSAPIAAGQAPLLGFGEDGS